MEREGMMEGGWAGGVLLIVVHINVIFHLSSSGVRLERACL